ncbi:YkyA family protein [Salicibibacter cibarius]|uniref:YkyA family protein n=1 Tax=Salicibibacter cibarius TaxID=2743000 RepID=A0A7T7CD62_9BACI|nr:YkyA family protein [Salicibibacter cibarius]QQK77645.1 YkyA family protein [Salicibibacter cibarius]
MNRLFVVMLGCGIVFLASCQSDEKQAVEIHEKIETSSSYEQAFASNQEDLEEYREKEQSLYNDLIELDIQDKATLQQSIDDAETYIEEQQALLDEAEENFQKAYEAAASILENIEEMNDQELKGQAFELLEMMAERKELVDTFCDDYQHRLKVLASFYEDLNDDEWSHDELEAEEDRIDQINNRNQVMEDVIQKFNKRTEQYKEVESQYFEMVALG